MVSAIFHLFQLFYFLSRIIPVIKEYMNRASFSVDGKSRLIHEYF